jgi:hypothetical protein
MHTRYFYSFVPLTFCLLGFSIMIPFCVTAQTASTLPPGPPGYWKAKWIAHPTAPGNDFGVYHFRKTIDLAEKPASFIIHLSADNRYRLFVNAASVATGPARSDLANWNFETIDIAAYLKKGTNTLAATVWNFGEFRPYAQISYHTAFIVQGDSENEDLVNTNSGWKVIKDSAYSPFPLNRAAMHTYIVTADGERMDGNKYAWGFEKTGYDDNNWLRAQQLGYPAKSRTYGTDGNWMLVPRSIPLMEETMQRLARLRKSPFPVDPEFVNGKSPLTIAAHSKMFLLLDDSTLTNAYPELNLSGGKEAEITLTYAEALVDAKGQKGNRDEVENKSIIGLQDRFIADGKDHRIYSPLHFRTYRYLQLEIVTKEEPLVINDIYGIFTGYPFKENASFHSDDASLQKIWAIGWHTARLCAAETYFDCPYYEQLQYVGDTRIQAMISLFVSGDDRLMRKAIMDIDHSRIPDGLTESRYPSRDMQIIPTFSLWWVCMIHDYWLHRKDDAFIQSFSDGMQNVLKWYEKRIGPNGLLGKLQWWPFVDWSWSLDSLENAGGVPPGGCSGSSSIITLQFAYSLQKAAQVFEYGGNRQLAARYKALASSLTSNTLKLCWDSKRNLLADRPDKKTFSQHANILAVLTDAIPAEEQKKIIQKIISDTTITQCTYYFKFYLFESLKKVKLGDEFLGQLKPWVKMMNIGLSTFAENPEPTRSDCHAWSASPVYELLSTVCGISSIAPGFSKVKIEPYLGALTHVQGTVPHPKGEIGVKLERHGEGIKAEIILPGGVNGIFSWKGKVVALKSGNQIIQL